MARCAECHGARRVRRWARVALRLQESVQRRRERTNPIELLGHQLRIGRRAHDRLVRADFRHPAILTSGTHGLAVSANFRREAIAAMTVAGASNGPGLARTRTRERRGGHASQDDAEEMAAELRHGLDRRSARTGVKLMQEGGRRIEARLPRLAVLTRRHSRPPSSSSTQNYGRVGRIQRMENTYAP